jgi:hypothetical protein
MTPAGSILVVLGVVGVFFMARFVRSMGDPLALARDGHVHRLRAMLEHDRSLAAKANAEGETPLHVAARHGHTEVIRVLLAFGADLKAKTAEGATARDLAVASGKDAATALLGGSKGEGDR